MKHSNELQWQQKFIDDGFTKFMLDTHKGTMYEYTYTDEEIWELVSTTNEWRCIKDVFTDVKYGSQYK